VESSTLLVNTDAKEIMRDPMVLQAMQLADRLRDMKGGQLEAEDYEAIAEATGVVPEYIKFAEQTSSSTASRSFLDNIRQQFFGLENDTRRMVTSGLLATFTALLWKIGDKLDTVTSNSQLGAQYGVLQTIAYVLMTAAIYNCAVSKNRKTGFFAGGIFGAAAFLMGALFGMVFFIPGVQVSPPLILVWAAASGVIGLISQWIFSSIKGRNASNGNQDVRQDLLKQLVELQEQLREGEQSVTFLSLDVVGSTKMKIGADALAIEFTFNEYHMFVERVAEKHFGRIHSTAGDGITVTFDHPQNAYNAARQIQTGLVEFNALRNKLGTNLQLRAGIHSGQVVAPEAGNLTSVNFASVIDIAAHLQKECPPGGIAVSDSAAGSIVGGLAGIGSERVCAHDTWATVWLRKRALDNFRLSEAPMLPGS
jgi:class 3 adenylate cyclase